MTIRTRICDIYQILSARAPSIGMNGIDDNAHMYCQNGSVIDPIKSCSKD